MHLLQICNVGQITGGTAACAWSVTRALPQMRHTVAFLSRTDEATRCAFADHALLEWPTGEASRVRSIDPDLILLHNICPSRGATSFSAPTIQYVHSVGTRLPADRTVYCSQWLAAQCGATPSEVLWQGVPRPPRPPEATRSNGDRLRVGRICTPTLRKWPSALIEFYTDLARQHPNVDWEYVGCPSEMVSSLRVACQGRATFHSAGWNARSHFWNWDALLYHHPTLTESFGRTVAEAARAGCLPIVDARGGFLEQLAQLPGRACGTREEFSAALHGCAATRLSDFSEKAQAAANRHFSFAAFGTRLWSLFDAVDTQ